MKFKIYNKKYFKNKIHSPIFQLKLLSLSKFLHFFFFSTVDLRFRSILRYSVFVVAFFPSQITYVNYLYVYIKIFKYLDDCCCYQTFITSRIYYKYTKLFLYNTEILRVYIYLSIYL